MREEKVILRVKGLVQNFDFKKPFSRYLVSFFRSRPEMGARDRRLTRELCFNYFRLGRLLNDLNFEQRLALSCFLCGCTDESVKSYLYEKFSFLKEFKEEDSLPEKMNFLTDRFTGMRIEDIFPMNHLLSPLINKAEWCLSFLHQPKVWIRVRKSRLRDVLSDFERNNFRFEQVEDLAFSFPGGVNLENTESWKKGYFEIQDLGSQHTADFFSPAPGETWWDACAGSGGKSLLLLEKENDLKLMATDTRESILETYALRLKKSRHENFETRVADLSKKNPFQEKVFDGIIADVPCSGSGTWSRSPEWLQLDVHEMVTNHYVPMQRKIISNSIKSLKAGKQLTYITCSVFAAENEENIFFFRDNYPLILEKYKYLPGYSSFSDTLFVASFSVI